ncbi:hypothetical protein F4808DRAFT_466512 [Astrocystis sublimbata]|nr:hypothetical protein F4808DRAFT_466512 [Astrocystis sublimbata]
MSSTITIPTSRSQATACGKSARALRARPRPSQALPRLQLRLAARRLITEDASQSAAELVECVPTLLVVRILYYTTQTNEGPDSDMFPVLTYLVGSALSKEECTHVDGGIPKATTPASSQGFAWNPEMFLPSYLDLDYEPLENRREPVIEIRLTDEEIKRMYLDLVAHGRLTLYVLRYQEVFAT